jgi:hypothetical protein
MHVSIRPEIVKTCQIEGKPNDIVHTHRGRLPRFHGQKLPFDTDVSEGFATQVL